MSTSLDEMHKIIEQDENVGVEFKGEITDDVMNGFSTDISAMANTQGGIIIFGVSSKKDPSGCILDGKERDRISQEASKCRPQVVIDFEEIPFGKRRFLIVRVPHTGILHSDNKGRFPIRIGAITEYLDGLSIFAILQARIYAGIKATQESQSQNREKRIPISDKLVNIYLNALRSDNPNMRAECLKDLVKFSWRHILLENNELGDALYSILTTGVEGEKELLFDIIRNSLTEGNEKEQKLVQEWLSIVEQIALAVPSDTIAQKAFDVLITAGDKRAVSTLVSWILTLSQQQYSKINIKSNLVMAKYTMLDIPIREAMYDLITKGLDEEKMKRVSEVLEAVRIGV